MKLISIDIKNIRKPKEIQSIVTKIIKSQPDVVVVMNYKRELQEEILHPLQKYMQSSSSECSKGTLIIWRSNLEGVTLDIKSTSPYSIFTVEIQEGKTSLIKSLPPRE